MKNKPLTTGEIAEYCHVTYRAVLKWVTEGKLKAYRTPGKHSRVHVQDFIDFLNKYHMPVPEGLSLQQGSQKKRIFIVDDDQHIANLILAMLKSNGDYICETALDGFRAGEKFNQFKPDLVTLDIKMKGLNGYEVCSYIRNELNNHAVKVLIVSGFVDDQIKEAQAKYRFDDYLSKPFDMDVLKEKIERLLAP